MKFATSIMAMVAGVLLVTLIRAPGSFSSIAGRTPGEARVFEIQPGVAMLFRWVPAGECGPFSVHGGEAGRRVLVEEGFWMSETEVTQHLWTQVMAAGKPVPLPNHPVHSVSWDDCMEFLSRLESPRKGWSYSLPTEAEWEYACRAGSTAPFHGVPEKVGWLEDNSGGRSHVVGHLEANAFGLHDMHGNVAEWCLDASDDEGRERAIRGGSWDSNFNAEASSRNSDVRGLRINRVGFRIVLRYQR
jgi:formylglycine-generating enzyme required for sulfatase activity